MEVVGKSGHQNISSSLPPCRRPIQGRRATDKTRKSRRPHIFHFLIGPGATAASSSIQHESPFRLGQDLARPGSSGTQRKRAPFQATSNRPWGRQRRPYLIRFPQVLTPWLCFHNNLAFLYIEPGFVLIGLISTFVLQVERPSDRRLGQPIIGSPLPALAIADLVWQKCTVLFVPACPSVFVTFTGLPEHSCNDMDWNLSADANNGLVHGNRSRRCKSKGTVMKEHRTLVSFSCSL
ncbi:hypothetical protein C8J56DRAFT_938744 [Mycena floridula]|nr:hypothetical protein C8J56DRAFT_938744 [Mycena floridula]